MNNQKKKISIFFVFIFLFIIGNLLFASQPLQDSQKSQAEQSQNKKKPELKVEKNKKNIVLHNEIIVTATRSEKTVFNVPKPVNVVTKKKIEESAPNNISELLTEVPGTDIVGVGVNQSRPIIRGLRGQRILLLTDGIRLSNSRRTQTFGEIPALEDVSIIERVEVVRGPASVLYGSEAIGGVINIISHIPDYNRNRSYFMGNIGYRFSSADNQHKSFAQFEGNIGHFGFMLNGTFRQARDYKAPAGSFGNITLNEETPVHDTGVRDNSFNLFLGLRLSENNDISFKYEFYKARNAGFGYVDPAAYSPGDPTIQLFYPQQKIQKFTLKYENRSLNFLLADGLSWIGYSLKNSRIFDTNISINFFPGAGMNIHSSNYTDVNTFGSRLELTKVLFKKHILTYGIDFFQDNSKNTDTNTMEIFGFGPLITSVDPMPKVPNAYFRSLGFFIQDDIHFLKKLSLIGGLRYQYVHAQTIDTPNLNSPRVKSTDSTLVGSANLIYGFTDNLKFIISLGRGFRSPNLPERFYQGITPDGGGFQVQNLELKPETSFNIDTGFRYRLKNFYAEVNFFRNMIYDGIQIVPTGLVINRLPEYKNINIEKLRLQGLELFSQVNFDFGFSLATDYSYITSKNLSNPELMYADTYGARLNLNIRYNFPHNFAWIEYHIRHNNNRKDVYLVNNPIGDTIPGFTVHSLRAGINIFKDSRFPQRLGIIIGNLTNTLYSEFSNASFFRPGPKRYFILTWQVMF